MWDDDMVLAVVAMVLGVVGFVSGAIGALISLMEVIG